MNYLKTIILKELWEIKYSIRKLLLLLLLCLIPLILIYPSNFAIIPRSYGPYILPAVVAFVISGQLAMSSLLNEKRTKTLEIILSSYIPKYAVIFGKIIPCTIIGFLYYIISLICLSGAAIFFNTIPNFTINLTNIFFSLIMSYLGCSIFILTTLYFKDDKVIPQISFIFIGVIGYLFYLFNKQITIDMKLAIIILIIISIMINIISIIMLKKSSAFLTNY